MTPIFVIMISNRNGLHEELAKLLLPLPVGCCNESVLPHKVISRRNISLLTSLYSCLIPNALRQLGPILKCQWCHCDQKCGHRLLPKSFRSFWLDFERLSACSLQTLVAQEISEQAKHFVNLSCRWTSFPWMFLRKGLHSGVLVAATGLMAFMVN